MPSLTKYLLDKGLSNREIEVTKELTSGSSNRVIGEKLFISEKTVKFHLTSVFKKLHKKRRTEVMAMLMGYKD